MASFRWAELLDGQQRKHPYLFEHQNRRNLWSFWKTYSRDGWPRKFWRDLNPAQPVQLARLLLYWMLANSFAAATIAPTLLKAGYDLLESNRRFDTSYVTRRYFLPGPQLDQMYPIKPWTPSFVHQFFSAIPQGRMLEMITPSLLVLAWPWATLAALLVF